ncbi:hypothetical protein B0T20DRAFT_92396 [Sordaria brevicollis]|uniref:Uncharacterized protein n=1 Tax=Sordaria brevicollis TaxID=83679 RepID=A0AAE0NWM0_SORBR|nr:hypothetical protein B0T20DRAFT_92396 [Sordaria brevicollis]
MASNATPLKRRRSSSAASDINQFASEELAALPSPIKMNPDSHIASEDIAFMLNYLPIFIVIDMYTSAVSDNFVQAGKIIERFNSYINLQKMECARNGDVAGLNALPRFVTRSASLTSSHLSAATVVSMLSHLPPSMVVEMFAALVPADKSLGWTIARRYNNDIIRRKWQLAKQIEDNEARGRAEAEGRKTVSIHRGKDTYVIDVQDIVDRMNSPNWKGNDTTRYFSDEEMEWITKYVLPLGYCPALTGSK